MKKEFQLPPLPAVLLSIMSIQGGGAIAKTLFPVLGAAATVILRNGLGVIMLTLVFRPKFKVISASQWRAVIPYGIVLGIMNVTFYMAIERTPLGLGVALEFIGPLVLAVSRSKRPLDFLWVLMAAIGIFLLSPWQGGERDVLGMSLAILAGALWAGYIVLGRKVSMVMHGGEAVTIGMMIATVIGLPFALFDNGFHHFTAPMIFPAVALALFSSALPFTLEMNALKKLNERTFSILMSIEPAAAALSGLIFLGEQLSFLEWLAIVFVIIASAGTTLTKREAQGA